MESKANKRGGARPGAGRKRGLPDKATAEQKATLEDRARAYTELALGVLAAIMQNGESESAKVTAANSMLDRGYGRPRQAVEMTGKDGGAIEMKNAGARDLIAERIAGIAARGAEAGATPKPN